MLTPSPLPVTVFDYLDGWLFCTRKKPVSQIQYTTFENIAKEHGKWIVPFLVKGSRDNVNQREIKQDGVEKSRLVEFFFFSFLFFFFKPCTQRSVGQGWSLFYITFRQTSHLPVSLLIITSLSFEAFISHRWWKAQAMICQTIVNITTFKGTTPGQAINIASIREN